MNKNAINAATNTTPTTAPATIPITPPVPIEESEDEPAVEEAREAEDAEVDEADPETITTVVRAEVEVAVSASSALVTGRTVVEEVEVCEEESQISKESSTANAEIVDSR